MTQGWPQHLESALALRHRLHRQPELTWQEHQTAATVREQLDRAGIPWRPCADTGTVARIAPAARGRHVALRADLDAMPIHEESGVPHRSESDGVMHACGHDGHVAALFAAGWWLRQHQDDLPGPVTLLFQPAEEGGHGAKRMIDDGALADVDAIFGWHNWPAIPFGQALCPDGPVMAGNGTFDIEVVGAGGHASAPDRVRDPVLAAAAITVALQQVVARRIPAQQATVVIVTRIDAPGSHTVVPDRAHLAGSIRVPDLVARDHVFALIEQIATATAAAHGVTAIVRPENRYGPTVNHPTEASEVRAALGDVLGPAWLDSATAVPIMASEDFSYYLTEVPGAFALLGADDGHGHAEPCHSARYDFNDALIDPAARLLVRLAGGPDPTTTTGG